jgi:sulfatase-modifying factor enzyme 1
MANTYQGHFPDHNNGEDGYTGIAPVAQYPPNGYGLYDMAGNVWQWSSDWYRPDYYQQLANAGGVARNPGGPESSFDPMEPNQQKKVHRGGSFLCTDQYCSRYVVGTRGKGEVTTGTNHLGFRCVMTREQYLAGRARGGAGFSDRPLCEGTALCKQRSRDLVEDACGRSGGGEVLSRGHRACERVGVQPRWKVAGSWRNLPKKQANPRSTSTSIAGGPSELSSAQMPGDVLDQLRASLFPRRSALL